MENILSLLFPIRLVLGEPQQGLAPLFSDLPDCGIERLTICTDFNSCRIREITWLGRVPDNGGCGCDIHCWTENRTKEFAHRVTPV